MTTVHHTHQEWFNLAWERAKLPRRSTGVGCVYSATSGTPGCFIGVGLPTEPAAEFDEHGFTAHGLYLAGHIPGFPTARAAAGLQSIHDTRHPDEWPAQLREYAATYNLQVPE